MRELTLPAIRVDQGPGRSVYAFAADGKDISEFSAISRLKSGGLETVFGYQRPEVVNHIAEIRRYLEGAAPVLPNAIVLAFDSSVKFSASEGAKPAGPYSPGSLTIRWDPEGQVADRPAWVVDGQQRLAAIRDAKLKAFPVCVTAFITDDADAQREQFILLNNSKPLPKSLIYELLPGTGGLLPDALARKRVPALLTRHLNLEERSPFFGRIRIATNPRGMIRDNSIMRMLEHSLSDGALMRLRLDSSLPADVVQERMLDLVCTFWRAVSETWPEAWKLPPRRSRLLHGAGVISLGFIMDEMTASTGLTPEIDFEDALRQLGQLKEVCFWTAGIWPFGEGRERRWNEVQNTSRDISLLSNYLLRQYRIRVRESLSGVKA